MTYGDNNGFRSENGNENTPKMRMSVHGAPPPPPQEKWLQLAGADPGVSRGRGAQKITAHHGRETPSPLWPGPWKLSGF